MLSPTSQVLFHAEADATNMLILGGGEVCMEFLKVRRGEERVVEVMRVSGDGQRVVIYTPGLSRYTFFLLYSTTYLS